LWLFLKPKQTFRVNGKVIYPLQSQAGMNNYNYFSEIRGAWWDNKDPEKDIHQRSFFITNSAQKNKD
jgi:hypothetical protein